MLTIQSNTHTCTHTCHLINHVNFEIFYIFQLNLTSLNHIFSIQISVHNLLV